jgi:glutamate-1-semialdehyde aminotransferase/putative hemolysin
MEHALVAQEAAPAKHEEYFKDLARRYGQRTQASKRYAERSRKALADPRRSAGFRPSIKEMLYPVVGRSAKDARLIDIDGNEYVDLTMGFGVHLFGHNPEFIRTAIKVCLGEGAQLGPQAERAGKVASRLCAMTGMARAVFCTTGTEAVMTALRLARAATGRDKVAVFVGSYHGHFDGTLGAPMSDGNGAAVPLAPGISRGAVGELLLLPYGDDRAFETIGRVAQQLAAVLVEPVQSRNPALQPASFLRALRQLTAEREIPLIFDEVITGFRAHPQGAQGWFGITADMAIYGKLLGGGLPIGVVAGRADLLAGIDGGAWGYGDDTGPVGPTTFFAGTYNKNPLTLAAADAVLDELAARGPTLQTSLNQKTESFVASLNQIFDEEEVPIRADHFASFFRFSFGANLDAFFYELLSRGVYIWEGRTCFFSAAHLEPDLAHVLDAVRASVISLRRGGLLPSRTPAPRPFACRAHSDESGRRTHDPYRGPAYARSDILDVRLAKTEDEIARALELRYRVFYEEMGARAGNDAAIRRRDTDQFDAVCDHLIVTDQSTGDLLGTYRLIRREAAERVGHFYSESEFEIGPLLAYTGELLELGRSCVAPSHRNGAAMTLLWNGIMDYVRRHDIRLLFGCASFPGRDPDAIAEQLALLHHRYRAPEELRPRAVEGRYIEMNRMALEQLDEERIMRGMPPLIRGYIAQGAAVGDGAVIDEAFNTVDVALVLLTDWLPNTDA